MGKRLGNNKGFSLVELIIVIAIMAVLIGIVAPKYVSYVEKAKIAADEHLLNELGNALMVLSTEPGVIEKLDEIKPNSNKGSEISIAFDARGYADFKKDSDLYDVNHGGKVWEAFSQIIDTDSKYRFQSKQFKGIVKEIKLTNNVDNGSYNSHNQIRLVYYNNMESEVRLNPN